MGSTAETPVLPSIRPEYRPRGPDPLRTLFRQRFSAFQASYEQRYAAFFGKFRLPLISRAASAFRLCGDWSQGIARIRGHGIPWHFVVPIAATTCSVPSREDLLLCLPHRQFVWTIPKVLRVFLRHDRQLFADIGRLLFDILPRFSSQAAGRTLRCAMVSSHQSSGEFAAWHPRWHGSPWTAEPRRGMDAERRGHRAGRRVRQP